MVICLERGADLHMAQLMPLPLTVSCFSEIQICFTFLVPAHLGSPGQRAVRRVCVCVCVCAQSYGGFVVAHILGDKDDTTVSCGIAVAPVTDFRYYGQPITLTYSVKPDSPPPIRFIASVAEWSACWTQAQKARVQIAVATLSGNSVRQTVCTHCASVRQAAKLVAALLMVAGVTIGLAESNGILPPGLCFTSPAG